MPIPLLVPVLLALGLAASSDAQEGDNTGAWTIDIDDDVFDRVGQYREGYVDIDFEHRRVFGFTGWNEPLGQRIVRLEVTRRHPGNAVKGFLMGIDLEGLRGGWSGERAGGKLISDILQSLWESESQEMVQRCGPREYANIHSEWVGSSETLTGMIEHGTVFFDLDDSFEVVGTEEQKQDVILSAIENWLEKNESSVGHTSIIPEEVVELRRLLGLPSRGLRVVFEESSDGPRDLDIKGLEFEPGNDSESQKVWDLFLF